MNTYFSIALSVCLSMGQLYADNPIKPAKGDRVTAQKMVTTEQGDLSIGILIPDRGMADPHVWMENGILYVMCGHDRSWEPVNTWVMDRWELWSTKDLTHWKHEYTIDPKDTYIGDQPNCWAGDLCERDGKYYWFFSNRNLNTGVMVADKITGPYRDLLGEPLLPHGIAKTHPYDPEIFVEDGEYHLCFGAGTYYMAPLAKDMKSLKTTPKAIRVLTEDGKPQGMGDKSALFKRGEWYYLMCGGRYAMSKELYGPYTYKGSFGGGGHNSFFQWDGQWYMVHETGDTNIFYRGIGLQPIYFRPDGTVHLAQKRASHPGTGRDYNFAVSQMGWHVEEGNMTLDWNKKGYIEGKVKQEQSSISSAIFLLNSLKYNNHLSFRLKNETAATKVRISLANYDKARLMWNVYPVQTDWTKHAFVDVEVEPNSKSWQTYTLDLDQLGVLKESLMQIKIAPAWNAKRGKWALDDIKLERK